MDKILKTETVTSTVELVNTESTVNEAEDRNEDSCKNGVCSLSWKPSRPVAA